MVQKRVHGNFVRSVHDRRHRSPSPECFIGIGEAWEAFCVGLLKREIPDLLETQTWEHVPYPVRIGEGICNRAFHVGDRKLRQTAPVTEFNKRMDYALRMHQHIDPFRGKPEKIVRLNYL